MLLTECVLSFSVPVIILFRNVLEQLNCCYSEMIIQLGSNYEREQNPLLLIK